MMVSLNPELESLRRSFSEVAARARLEYPKLWACAANAGVAKDNEAIVFTLTRPLAGFANRNLLEVAQTFGEETAIEEVQRLEAGGFA